MTHLLFDPKEKWCGVTAPKEPPIDCDNRDDNCLFPDLCLCVKYEESLNKALSQKIPVRPEDQFSVSELMEEHNKFTGQPEEGKLYLIPAGVELEPEYQYRTNHWTVLTKEQWDCYDDKERKRIVLRLKELAKENTESFSDFLTVVAKEALEDIKGKQLSNSIEDSLKEQSKEETQDELFDLAYGIAMNPKHKNWSQAKQELLSKFTITKKQ